MDTRVLRNSGNFTLNLIHECVLLYRPPMPESPMQYTHKFGMMENHLADGYISQNDSDCDHCFHNFPNTYNNQENLVFHSKILTPPNSLI